MRYRKLRQHSRMSFTLLELLVVIAIIAVLAGLLLSAVTRILSKPPEVSTRNDMSQLDGAIQKFQTKYGVSYIPSQIKLCQKYSSYGTSQLDQDSIKYLQQTIGQNTKRFTATWQSTGINWLGPNTPAVEILEGDQCLVFFLGGIQSLNGSLYTCLGFSADPSNPANLATSPGDGPIYNFQTSRLMPRSGKNYCSYADAYGKRFDGNPRFYAYFSAYKTPNGYNPYGGGTDCPTLGPTAQPGGVWPYASTPASGNVPIQYVNSDSYQIICCGADGVFGPGTNPTTNYYWNASTAPQLLLNPLTAGADDQANFASHKLSVPN